jgi:hypothetical protein
MLAEQSPQNVRLNMTGAQWPSLITKEYRTLSRIAGPLIFVERIRGVAYGEIVEVTGPSGEVRLGQVLEVDQQLGIVQVFGGTSGLDLARTRARFTGEVARLGVSLSMLGRVLDGSGQPIDGGPPIVAETALDINGLPLNPSVRTHPSEFIQTGVSAIDGLNTLTRAEAPIFRRGHRNARCQIAARRSSARAKGAESFVVVFRRRLISPRGVVLHGPVPRRRRDGSHRVVPQPRRRSDDRAPAHAARRAHGCRVSGLHSRSTCAGHPDGYDQLLRSAA